MQELSLTVGKNLTELRKSKHLTQQELAERIGYSDKSLSKWELGKAIPSVDILKQLADFYGVSVDFLLEEGAADKKALTSKASKNDGNKIVITAMAACFVLFTAVAIFVNALFQNQADNSWIVFVWMVPATMLTCGLLSLRFWGRTLAFWILASIFVWSLLAALALTIQIFKNEGIWYIFMIAVPLQISIVLFAKIKK